MKKIILTAALGIVAAGANAQIRFGAEVGVQLANLTTTYDDPFNPGKSEHVDARPNIGLRGGLVAQFGITDHIAIQPAVLFVMKGARQEDEQNYEIGGIKYTYETQSKINLNNIQIPINIQYTMNEDGTGFFAGVGPYVSYAFAGKAVDQVDSTTSIGSVTTSGSREYEYDLEFGDELGDNYKNLDVGIGANVGYMLPMGAFVRAFGEYGFSNIFPGTAAALINGKTRNYGFGLTIGYMIGGSN